MARSLHKAGILSELLSTPATGPPGLQAPAAHETSGVSSTQGSPDFADAELEDLPEIYARSLLWECYFLYTATLPGRAYFFAALC